VISSSFVCGRDLSCTYSTGSSYAMWPTFSYCLLSSTNFSEGFKEEDHSFVGTFAQKLAVTTLYKQLQKFDELEEHFVHQRFRGITICVYWKQQNSNN
jgi:hypothetical protein